MAFFGPDIKTEMAVVIYMYLEHSPDYIDSQYIWVYGSRFKCFCGNTIFGIFSLTQGKEVWLSATQPMLLPESSCVYISSFSSVAPRVFLVKILCFLGFLPLP